MKLYNFSPKTLQWFKPYLVKVESKLSDPLKVGDQGVPQSSWTLCFIIFSNDRSVREEGTSVLYADEDTDNVRDEDPLALQ